jgi:carbon-monoxide dehydrogenase small subunit
VQVDGAEIETVEGLAAEGHQLHPVQEAFWEAHGLQCGFCTPGLLLTTLSLLDESPNPSVAEIRAYLSGNVCRCTGYRNIIDSVRLAAHKLAERHD